MVKTCENCAHRKGKDPCFYYCLYHQTYCDIAVSNRFGKIRCGEERVNWEERPSPVYKSDKFLSKPVNFAGTLIVIALVLYLIIFNIF